ncbi:MAG: carboxypeptidase regulatory-like domain-containing protein [Pyrinomonadaceae bacterium]
MKNRIAFGALLVGIVGISFVFCLPSIRDIFWADGGETAGTRVEFSEPRTELDPEQPVPLETVTEQTVAVDPVGLVPDVTRSQPYYPGIIRTNRPPEKLAEPVEIARVEIPKADREPASRQSDDPEGRVSWFMQQRLYPYKELPEDARRRAWQEVLDRGEGFGPEEVGTTWTPIGPAPTAGAGPGGAVSGRINAIAISPTNTQLILVAGGTGGIWRSTNGGTTFVPVTDSLPDLAVGTIAFAPSDPNIVYAGLGDSDNGYWGTGVLRSNDAGATWTRVNNTSLPNRVQATRIQVDPADPNRVYLALNTFQNPTTGDPVIGGVLVSTNGGVNWTAPLRGLATDLAIHPTNPQILYAALRFGSSEAVPRGVFKSTNSGQTWTNILASPYTAAQSSTKDIRVAVTPAAPDRVYAYFGTDGPPKELRIEVSDDAGATFTNRGVISNNILDPGQFGYNTYLEASPTDPNTIYIGCRDTFRSTDGGVTFTNLINSHAPPYDPGDFTEQLQKIHTDQQAFAFEPGSSTIFYAGNDGGIKTTNSGTTFTSLNQTLSLVQFIGISLHPSDPTRSYGGAQDNGTQRRVSGGLGWTEFVGGDGGKSVINPLNPTMVFPSFTNGNISRVTNDGTGTSAAIASAAVFGEQGDGARIGFYPPIVSNGVDPRIYSGSWRLFICTDCDDLSRNLDGGTPPTWTAPGGMFDQTKGGSDVLSAITIARSNLNVIYTGSTQGRAMISTNGGSNWTDITQGLPDRSIRSIVVSPTDPSLVYLTVSGYGSGHVFRSTNSGANWTDISGNLPNIPTSAFMIDRLTPTTLYAGTDIGVFRSTDNGASWSVFNNGLPPVAVMEFASQANGLIQIATYGRGAYELPLAGGPTPTPTPTPTPGATPTPTPTPTITPTPTPTPATTPTPTPTPTPVVTPTPTPVVTPTPTPVMPTPTPTPTPTPSCTPNANLVQDGGFEANTDAGTNPNWASTSTAFGTSLCTAAGCGTLTTPRTGNGWLWFDGTGSGAAENGTAQQMITIQPGRTATLSYYLRIANVAAPSNSVLTITVDGTVVQTIAEPAVAESAYTLRTVDLSAFANGVPRSLSFNYSRPGGAAGSDNFLIDDITLSTTCVQTVVSVSGRVTTPTGLGLRNAVVSLIDPQNVRRTATTSSFGIYTFSNIPAGVTYIVSVGSKRYRFAPQTITINSNLSNVDFVGLE